MKIIITESQHKLLFENQTVFYYEELIDILNDYNYEGVLDFNTNYIQEPKLKNIFNCLVKIIDELKEYGISSDDYINYNNLGYNEDGRLCYFDIGYGDFYEEFEDQPSEVSLNELDLKLDSDMVNKILKKYTTQEPVMLGDGGNFGAAYDLGNGDVLKITTDKTEAINSKKLIGKPTQYLAKIFDVKFFKSNDKVYYIIHLEKLFIDDNLNNDLNKLNEIIIQNQNTNFKHDIIPTIGKKNPVVAEFLEFMYNYGYQETWSKYRSFVDNYPQYDFNDISDISEWIYGSKTNDNRHTDSPPESILNLVRSLV